VDFGNFAEAVHRFTDGKPAEQIGFGFRLSLPIRNFEPEPLEATLWVRESSKGSTETAEIRLTIFGSLIRLVFDTREKLVGVLIDDEAFELGDETSASIGAGGLFPKFLRGQGLGLGSELYSHYFYESPRRKLPFISPMLKWISSNVHGRTSDFTKLQIARKMQLSGVENTKSALLRVKQAPKSWFDSIKSLRSDSATISAVKRAWLLSRLPSILESVDRIVSSHLHAISYTKPVRATAERYYRKQDLSIQDIDPEGANTAMFLDSLSRTELSKFNDWTSNLLNIEFKPQSKEGHVAIRASIRGKNGSLNLADIGFGYSQLLPILVQVWNAKFRRFRLPVRRVQSKRQILVEQPELHLHPHLQANVGLVLASATSENEGQVAGLNFMIETHSEHLISAIGDLILNRKVAAGSVQLVFFEATNFAGPAKVRRVKFNAHGELTNWPIGFYSP
jgi:hypothetical protein